MRMTRSMSANPGGAQVGEPGRRTAESVGKLGPGEPLLLSLVVELLVQLRQVPAQASLGPRFRQEEVTHVDHRTGQEVLRGAVEPTQHEQRVLARGRTALGQPLDRPAAQRVVVGALDVEARRLLPQLVRELVPAQPILITSGVERSEQVTAFEGQHSHMTPP